MVSTKVPSKKQYFFFSTEQCFSTSRDEELLKNIRGNGRKWFPLAGIRSIFKKWFPLRAVMISASRKELSSKVDGFN